MNVKLCDVCGRELGFIKFRYVSGNICKSCYETASRNFTETIRELELGEINRRCSLHSECLKGAEDFELSKRIGNYMLIDEVHKQFCVLSGSDASKTYCLPNFYSLDDVKYCKVSSVPEHGIVTAMGVEVFLHSQAQTQQITLFSSPIRRRSYAFRRTSAFFEAIVSYFESNGVVCTRV